MLSKEQIEKRIAEIRKTPGAVLWPTGDRVELALNEAEALEELLSLREQLAELKALEPAAYLIHEKGGGRQLRFLGLDAVSQADIEEHELWQDPLFTAAKPAED